MTGQYILSDYLDRVLAQAEYDKLENGTFFGLIPSDVLFSIIINF